MLKFLVDESTGIGVSEKLKNMGFDSVSVIETMKGAEDLEVIREAKKENRIIVINEDFGWLATIHKPPGLMLLRLKKESIEMKIGVLLTIINKYQNSIYGNMIIATEKKIRIRPL